MKYVVGVDEAGRGPLAGPLVVSGICFLKPRVLRQFGEVKDSKQLTEPARNELYRELYARSRYGELFIRTAKIPPHNIDKEGIQKSAKRGVGRILPYLVKEPALADILLDGSLYAPSFYRFARTIPGGDASEPAIALASVVAKVTRDAIMRRHGRAYPGYGFEKHKGYGTKEHYAAIRKLGITPLHRISFLASFRR